ncbi:interferon alpha/beta receptor 1a-like [Synchiropus picturatus]
MWATVCWTLLTLAVGGSAEPAPPQNLTMVTLNTNYQLHWDWNGPPTDHVTFTVQYLSSYKVEQHKDDWSAPSRCENTTRRLCDLTHQNLFYFGCYTVRVRAIIKGDPSNWTSTEFCPDRDARLGPPSRVQLSPAGADLEVEITDPLTSSNTSMREMCSSLRYLLLYWEHGATAQRSQRSRHNREVLRDLQPQTRYCVAVQSVVESYANKSSAFTAAQCAWTAGAPPWWQILLYFLGPLLASFLLVLPVLLLVFRCYRTVKSTCWPAVALPETLRQLLSDSAAADRPGLLTAAGGSCDRQWVCSELIIQDLREAAADAETAPPLGAERDDRCHLSSGDSGVYSLDGGASSQQLSDHCGSSWQEQLSPERGAVGAPV